MMTGSSAGRLALAAVFVLGVNGTCNAVEFLAAGHQGSSAPSTLYAVDSDDGSATAIGPIGFNAVSGMDFDAMGTLYATGFRVADSVHVLITIDPMTGAGTEVGPTGLEQLGEFNTADLSFRPSDGVLFAYLEPSDELGVIDTTSGAVTLIGSTQADGCCGNGIAFVGATLHHANDFVLATLDQATGMQENQLPLVFDLPMPDGPRASAMDASPGGTLVATLKNGFSGSGEVYLAAVGKSGNVRTLVETQAGLDALAIPPGVDFDVDADPPTCVLDTMDLTGTQVQFTIQDSESGLASINATTAANASCTIPPFMVGTTDPVVVVCDAIDMNLGATVQLQATDVDGNIHDCEETTFNMETEPPFCFLYAALSGPPAQVTYAVGDVGSGLALVQTPVFVNVQSTAAFTPGTNDTIFLPVTPIDPSLTSAIQFRIFDRDGNQRLCSPTTFQRFALEKNGTLRESFTNVTNAAPVLTIKNGNPGFTRLKFSIGRFRQTTSLSDGQVAVFNVLGALSPGNNTVQIQAWGKAGASMTLFAHPSNTP